MPPYTKLPRPAGHLQVLYDPMSPPNWGIVPFSIEISVYPDVRVALKALVQATTTIQAQRLEEGTAELRKRGAQHHCICPMAGTRAARDRLRCGLAHLRDALIGERANCKLNPKTLRCGSGGRRGVAPLV